ncbi:hypothetical protein HZY97_18650 [Sphingomonas sp. R-74633]|uniref:hypothetical protein n=1 Tax=Sphingomonas sp. R-74633 TaxID=2751188 RepID=UPI0015D12BBD|nr:hypothetical protein [Sphingomonas sp. R-74633]NYT42800.1 hypothetical protein [Sphingomonas sp. R-74633]
MKTLIVFGQAIYEFYFMANLSGYFLGALGRAISNGGESLRRYFDMRMIITSAQVKLRQAVAMAR